MLSSSVVLFTTSLAILGTALYLLAGSKKDPRFQNQRIFADPRMMESESQGIGCGEAFPTRNEQRNLSL